MARNISCEGKKRQGRFARWMWNIRDLVARHGVFGLRFRRHYSHTLSRNIWKKHCPIGGLYGSCSQFTFLFKTFPHFAKAFVGQGYKKARIERACTKKQILQSCMRQGALAQPILGCRETSSSSTTASGACAIRTSRRARRTPGGPIPI